MNQQIKDFVEQCWDRRLDGLHFDKEMFAELIIKQCAAKAQDVATMPGCSDDMAYGGYMAALLIKKHFGMPG